VRRQTLASIQEGMLIVHAKDNVVWVTDLISPRGEPIGRIPARLPWVRQR
jgi:hypothetical protein